MDLDAVACQVALAPTEDRTRLARELRTWCLGQGTYLASLGRYYRAMARGDVATVAVPAFNLRGLTYDLARAAWRAALALEAGPLVFELAPSEADASDQPFCEYGALVLAAAQREGYRGPVFLQGDHFHIDSLADLGPVKTLCQEALDAGFFQIDVDAAEVQAGAGVGSDSNHSANAQVTADVLAFIRRQEPFGHDVVIGGEVGIIGGWNTTPADLRDFLDATLARIPKGVCGLDKVSVQTGTRHGGNVLADGSLGDMPLDLALTMDLSRIAREEYGLPGLVQHGASTLSMDQIRRLPKAGVVEVHLASGIQNLVLDHPAFPARLLRSVQDRLVGEVGHAESGVYGLADELTEQQRLYHSRWRAWGLIKRDLCLMPSSIRDTIAASAQAWFADILVALGTAGHRGDVELLYPAHREGEP